MNQGYKLQAAVTDGERGTPSDLRAVAVHFLDGPWKDAYSKANRLFWAAIAVGAAGLIVAISIGVGSSEAGAGIVVGALGLIVAGVLLFSATRIRPGRRVRAVHRIYWPLLALALEDKTALYDVTGAVVPKIKTHHKALRDPVRLNDITMELATLLDELEILEPEEEQLAFRGVDLFGIDARLAHLLTSVEEVLADTQEQHLELPVLPRENPLTRYLVDALNRGLMEKGKPQAHSVPHLLQSPWKLKPGRPSPTLKRGTNLDVHQLNDSLEGAHHEAGSQERLDVDDTLLALQQEIEGLMRDLEEAHHESLSVIEKTHSLVSHTAAWPALVFYCPSCNLPEEGQDPKALEASTRLKEDPTTGGLFCTQCNRSFPEENSIILLRHRDEVFYPTFDQMLLTFREEILRIDRDIENQLVQIRKEQKIKLQETRMQVSQERRKRVAQLRQYRSKARSLAEQATGVIAALSRYQKIQQSKAIQFTEDCNRISAEVARKAEQAVAIIEREAAQRQMLAEQESSAIAQVARAEEAARHGEVMEAMKAAREQAAAQHEDAMEAMKAAREQAAAQHEEAMGAAMLTESQKKDVQSGGLKGWFAKKKAKNTARGF